MGQSRIPVRYAKALFLLAKENNILDIIRKDMDLIHDSCRTIIEFRMFLHSPIITTSKKESIIGEMFSNMVHPHTLSFLKLIAKNRREHYLEDIARDFIDLQREELGIKRVTFTSAAPIDEDIRKTLILTVKKLFQTQIELHEETDQSLIGGFVIKIDDQQYDASIASKLKEIEREMTI